MADYIRRYGADLGSIQRKYPIGLSEFRAQRLDKFFVGQLSDLKKVGFEKLNIEGQLDYVLLRQHLENRMVDLKVAADHRKELGPLTPFAADIIALDEKLRADMGQVDPRATAVQLNSLAKQLAKAADLTKDQKIKQALAVRAAKAVSSLSDVLEHWYRFYAGYDPTFTWWCEAPYKACSQGLGEYKKHLMEKVAGIAEGDSKTIVGDPIGRDALLADLRADLIDYTPEELIDIANQEFTWCEGEMKKACLELGFKDWKKGLEHVKNLYVEPGQQPKLIRDLAVEAIDFIEKRNLVSVPDLAKETWRMEMMSPERQLESPFFLGGESILVSFPTQSMEHDAKMMSLRGNNPHFARATVQHELIPGHHLQQFYMSRNNPHRELFGTPFWIEGWALYWEFLLWDMGFPRGPEDKIGMLFWRMHRCARIIFSLKFHLGEMTPQECVDFLVDRVGHERDNASAEVRRSFAGNYPPLYQAAYMLGALQFRALRNELVDTGTMSEKAFHDAILVGNEMPVAMVRARLSGTKLTRDFRPNWRFYDSLKRK